MSPTNLVRDVFLIGATLKALYGLGAPSSATRSFEVQSDPDELSGGAPRPNGEV